MNISNMKSLLFLLFITAQSIPAMADILIIEKINGIEVEIRRPANGKHPLIIFSHGMGACPSDYSSIQSRLVDAGYVVVAPKHADCITGSSKPDLPWRVPEKWTDKTNSNRKQDIHSVLDFLPFSNYVKYINTFEQVGCMGHSMGGYTCMGLAGGWNSWKRDEINSIALFSPWNKPYLVQERVVKMNNLQTLYQGGSKDHPISTDLIKPNGTYDKTEPSKYLQIFKRARHSSWTDGMLAKRFHEQMSYYTISFFDLSLKGSAKTNLEIKMSQVKELQFKH